MQSSTQSRRLTPHGPKRRLSREHKPGRVATAVAHVLVEYQSLALALTGTKRFHRPQGRPPKHITNNAGRKAHLCFRTIVENLHGSAPHPENREFRRREPQTPSRRLATGRSLDPGGGVNALRKNNVGLRIHAAVSPPRCPRGFPQGSRKQSRGSLEAVCVPLNEA